MPGALVTVLAPCTTTYPSLSRSTTPAAKISGWRMADSHEYGVGVQRAFFSGHHVTYGNAADTGRCHSRSFDCQARNGNRCTGVLCGEEVPVMEVTTVLVSRVMVGLALARSTMICEARKLSRR